MCKQIDSIVDKIDLKLTCVSCPEQYDAEYRGELVGYLRLRWGSFYVYYPWEHGEVIYGVDIGNPMTGRFTSIDERNLHLAKAKKAIAKMIIK